MSRNKQRNKKRKRENYKTTETEEEANLRKARSARVSEDAILGGRECGDGSHLMVMDKRREKRG